MANNRIGIKCRVCGEILGLGKRLADGYYCNDCYGRNLTEKLNEFYEKHEACFTRVDVDPDGWPDVFDIYYEFEPEWLKEKNNVAAVRVER